MLNNTWYEQRMRTIPRLRKLSVVFRIFRDGELVTGEHDGEVFVIS